MISAIVLAAGEATRFGQCKQLARLGDKTLLEHVLDNVNRSNVNHIVVVLGANAETVRSQIRFGKEKVVLNEQYSLGMSSSIQAGLRALPARADAAVIVLADQPLVTWRTLNILIDEYRRRRPSVAIPTYKGFRGNPVLIDRSLFPEMMEIRGDIGCRAIFGDHPQEILKVAVDDPGIVSDIDTAQDLERARGVVPPVTSEQPRREDVLETIVELRKRQEPFAVATVVRVERPTSSKPGDKAVIKPDRTLIGWVGGSCAHDLVVENALKALQDGSPRFLTLSNFESTKGRRQGVIEVPMTCYSGGVLDIFIEPNLPKPQLVVVGYEPVARALVRIGNVLQFHVTVLDPLATRETAREADEIVNELNLPALPMRAESFIVIATHGRYDEEALEQAVQTNASYVALVASPRRAAVILEQLRSRGISSEALAKVKSPAGLDLGAVAPEEIALSVLAEIVQLRRAGALKRAPLAQPAAPPDEAIDPICKMTVAMAGARYSSEHQGRRYYFCCAHCQRTFEKEPDRYIGRIA